MTHTYAITGMTCNNCESTVKDALLTLPDVDTVDVSRATETATVTMKKHIPLGAFQQALGGDRSKYRIQELPHNNIVEQSKSTFNTYKPLIIVFAFIAGISLITASGQNHIDWHSFMNNFMAGFFLAFSFFKFLDLQGFAESYAMYDIVAMKWKSYGFMYPFIELALGAAYLIGYDPPVTNIATIVVMGVSSIGVLKSVLKKQKIQCACLGAVFNLPMSTITVVEDLLMVAMSLSVLLIHHV